MVEYLCIMKLIAMYTLYLGPYIVIFMLLNCSQCYHSSYYAYHYFYFIKNGQKQFTDITKLSGTINTITYGTGTYHMGTDFFMGLLSKNFVYIVFK